MNNLDLVFLVILVALFFAVVVKLFITYRSTSEQKQQQKQKQKQQQTNPHYQPKESGHRTGQSRLFLTNKGLRSYEVNSEGYPVPNKVM